jgi:hypothetical protein
MRQVMSAHIFIELVKRLAWIGENFPDDPRLGRKLLLGGGLLLSSIFLPENSPEWGDAILIAKSLCVIAGAVCIILGAFVFFRRWVWRRQDNRPPVIITLRLK